MEAVRQSRADAAVVWARLPDQRDLDGVVLGLVEFGVALPQGHPLTDHPVVLADHLDVPGIEVRPLEPALCLELEVAWRAPARPALRTLVDYLANAARDPHALIGPPR
jgi:DNA-binding transcriptional LysR family regulator